MSSPTSRRSSCRGGGCGTRASLSDCGVRRRSSSCSYFSSGGQNEDFPVSLSQPIFTITLRFLLAIDLWLSKRLGVCACEDAPWGGIRPLVRLVESSGHVVPWLIGAVYTLLRAESAEEQEVMLNLALGELRTQLQLSTDSYKPVCGLNTFTRSATRSPNLIIYLF